MSSIGFRVYGLGVVAISLLCLAWGAWDPGQPMPKTFPSRTALAYAAAAFMLITGAAVEWRRTAALAAGALAAYYTLVVVVFMYGRLLSAHYAEFGAYSGAAEQLVIAAAGLIIFAVSANINGTLALRLTRLGQMTFGVCAVLFGGAHFFYMNLTAPLVPQWLPPSQQFWAYATGAAQIAAGVAIFTGVSARAASILLTVMYASFTVMVHGPMLLANPADHYVQSENALNIALIGAAWVVADSVCRASE